MERETDTDIYVPRSRSFGMFAEQCVDEQYYLTIFVINNSVFLSCLSVCLQLRYVNLYIKRIWMSEWIMLQLRNFFEIPKTCTLRFTETRQTHMNFIHDAWSIKTKQNSKNLRLELLLLLSGLSCREQTFHSIGLRELCAFMSVICIRYCGTVFTCRFIRLWQCR